MKIEDPTKGYIYEDRHNKHSDRPIKRIWILVLWFDIYESLQMNFCCWLVLSLIIAHETGATMNYKAKHQTGSSSFRLEHLFLLKINSFNLEKNDFLI